MRKLSLLFFFLLFISLIGKAQTLTRMQSWGLDFESIHWISDQKGVIVGEDLIAYTEDGGTTWKEVLQMFDLRFYDVLFSKENIGVAVGEKGAIFISNDFGKSWTQIESGTSLNLYALESLPNGSIFIVGQGGIILKAENTGSNWQIISPGNKSFDLMDIAFFSDQDGYSLGGPGKILKTTNGGNTWIELNSGISESLKGLTISPTHILYAVGEKGRILKSVDFGVNWTKLSSPIVQDLTKIKISPLDEKVLVISGQENTILRSINSGSTFSKINLPNTNSRKILDLDFKPGTQIVHFVGTDGYSMFSNNSGANWTLRLLGNRGDFSALDFVTDQFGLIGGTAGRFFVSANGMQTLIERPIPEQIDLYSLEFWNSNYGFATGANGRVYRTSNSGQTWTPVNLATSKSVKGIHLFLPEFPYLVGQSGLIARSSGTSGNSWELFDSNSTGTSQDINDILGFDLQNALAVGNGGYISISNNGFEWKKIPSGTDQDLIYSTRFDDTSAFVVGKNGTILKTTDFGNSWELIPTEYTEDLFGVDFFGEKVGFIVGENGLFLITSDGGETWEKYESGTIRNLHSIFAINENKAFAVGNDGTILAYNCIPPTGSLGSITGETSTCLGSATYSINSNPEPGSEIVWRVDGGEIIQGQGTNSLEVNWTSTGRNAILVSRVNFCGAGETSFLEVQVEKIPPSNLTIQGEGTVCQNQVVSYSLPQLSGVTYTWSTEGGTILQGQGTRQIEIEWKNEGSATLSVQLENLCGKSSSAITLPIQILSKPSQPSEITGEILVGLGNQIYSIVGLPDLNYRWTVSDGGKILTGQGSSKVEILWEKEGKFDLSVEAQNACDFGPNSSLQVTVNIITGIEPNPMEGEIKIYPNPSFNGSITIESLVLDQWSELEIFKPTGQKIGEQIIEPGVQSIYLENLPKGIVFVRLSGSKGSLQKKILIL